MPPPDTTLRRRSGYRAIDTDGTTALVDEPEGFPESAGDDVDIDDEREVVQREGWIDLLYSFLASGAMTVRTVIIFSRVSSHPSLKLAAYFFPIVFAIPLFGKYLAREWLWSFTPSLSYVGQGTRGFI